MDAFRPYDYALSTTQVAGVYNGLFTGRRMRVKWVKRMSEEPF